MKNTFKNLLRVYGYKIERYENITYKKNMFNFYENFNYLIETFKIEQIDGVIVECGFGYGRSFTILSHFANKLKKKIYGFDSFAGFPQVTELDNSFRKPINGEWAVRTLNEAKNWIKNSNIFEDHQLYELSILEFSEHAKNYIADEKICLLHIDLDLYNGYKYALELFWDQVQPGGIIVFDELYSQKWPGATLAVVEFLASKNLNEDIIQKVNDKYYILKN